ncbi:MAG: hypothetical protein JRN06_06000 [Nitrososphaerota archaeon]|nr:hypothetical protein [Nitrososphaerota archaeon]
MSDGAAEKPLKVRGDTSREYMRRMVVSAFLAELPGNVRKVRYHYKVETMKDGRVMRLVRPTGVRKGPLDFKVEVSEWGSKGTHDEIKADLLAKKREDTARFQSLMKAVRDVHACREPESILAAQANLEFKSGWSVELLLKVLKWFFILEDVDYWNYNGRDELMDFIEKSVGP